MEFFNFEIITNLENVAKCNIYFKEYADINYIFNKYENYCIINSYLCPFYNQFKEIFKDLFKVMDKKIIPPRNIIYYDNDNDRFDLI